MLKQGIFISFLSYSAFAFMDLINKFLFAKANIPFFSYVLFLDLAIILALIVFIIISKQSYRTIIVPTNPKGIFIRSIFSVGNTLCSLVAISTLPFHMFYALIFLQPLIASLISIIIGLEETNKQRLFLIVFGFTGILISIQIWNFPTLTIPLIGILGGLGVALTGALSGIVVKKYLPNENTLTIAVYNILLSLIVVSVYFIFKNEQIFKIENFDTFILIITAGFLAAFGIILFMRSYQIASVQAISQLQYIQIIWGVFFGYTIFNEIPSWYALIGIAIIIATNFANLYLQKE